MKKPTEYLPAVGDLVLIEAWWREARAGESPSTWKACVVVRREDSPDKRAKYQSRIWVSPSPPNIGEAIGIRRTCDLSRQDYPEVAVQVEPEKWVNLRRMRRFSWRKMETLGREGTARGFHSDKPGVWFRFPPVGLAEKG